MKLILTEIPKSLNKAYLKQDLHREQIDTFKANLKVLFSKIEIAEKKKEHEEHFKNIVSDFLKDTYYKNDYEININKRKDLVIHNGKTSSDTVGVIIEAKRPSNEAEMISKKTPNAKALHELLHYYMQERFINDNKELKHIIATNTYDWYIFDAADFECFFYENTKLRKSYEDWNNGVLVGTNTNWFYDEVAKPYIDKELTELEVVYFNLHNYKDIIKNNKIEDDDKLINLYKILSPEHLLKRPFANDSNTLNKEFYNELLHIIGLEEKPDGGKKLIDRKGKNRDDGSLLENTINILKVRNKLGSLEKPEQFGATEDDQLYSVGLELCITWLNRILFLKLLEGQLIKYHNGNPAYSFINSKNIKDFKELDELFFEVLAVNTTERSKSVNEKYINIPYLNSSLFEISYLESKTIQISELKDRHELTLYAHSVLKNKDENKKLEAKNTLHYLFEFLSDYNFSSDSSAKIQEDNKTIINASVLGLIFEKINGYKDGSFFTPGFITMYMCRETIRLAVAQKFKELENPDIETFDDVKNYCAPKFKKDYIARFNNHINSLKLCDPAVGSGHFLVSALNEIIAIKSELNILTDAQDTPLEYEVTVDNDELTILNKKTNKPFEYLLGIDNKPPKALQQVQVTLFQEKQNIIENCLFGVDINPKSVLICRLRLWIELLKNAYYKPDSFTELETLPNIDINIKCGNSLISRYKLKDDVFESVPNFIDKLNQYKFWVNEYKRTADKNLKLQLTKNIRSFTEVFKHRDPRVVILEKQVAKKSEEYLDKFKSNQLFGHTDMEGLEKQRAKIEKELKKLTDELEELKSDRIFENAFEWRFEFPEVLNSNGEFDGFDLIIGNPPYIKEDVNRDAFNGIRNKECYQGKMDIWYMFGDLGLRLMKHDYYLCFIATNNWVTNSGASNFRNIVIRNSQIVNLTDFGAYMIFENASIQTMIMLFKNNDLTDNYNFDYRRLGNKLTQEEVLSLLSETKSNDCIFLRPKINKVLLTDKTLTFNSDINSELLDKIKSKHNFFLREKAEKDFKLLAEVGSGIDVLQDFVSKTNAEKLKGNANIGDGVFVLSNAEYEKMMFSKKEKEIIKPYFTTEQLQKYYGNPVNKYWILYTKSDIGKLNKKTKKIPINDYPKIKEHLDKFNSIITSDNKPYGLHRTREQHLFEGEKIFALRKCPTEPKFTYTDFDSFVSRAFLVVQSDRIDMKYLTGLFNSKLIAFWLRKKGKMQGNAYQLDKEPLLEIPIYNPLNSEANEIAEIVDKILTLKKQETNTDTSEFESEIDQLVYQLYELTPEEIEIIEKG